MEPHLSGDDQMQYLIPGQLEAALRAFAVIYVPFGLIEWHVDDGKGTRDSGEDRRAVRRRGLPTGLLSKRHRHWRRVRTQRSGNEQRQISLETIEAGLPPRLSGSSTV